MTRRSFVPLKTKAISKESQLREEGWKGPEKSHCPSPLLGRWETGARDKDLPRVCSELGQRQGWHPNLQLSRPHVPKCPDPTRTSFPYPPMTSTQGNCVQVQQPLICWFPLEIRRLEKGIRVPAGSQPALTQAELNKPGNHP